VSDTAFIVGRRVNVAATSSSRRQESDIRPHLNKFGPLLCWAGVKGTVVGSVVLECAIGPLLCWAGVKGTVVGSVVLECAIGPLLCWAAFGTCSIAVEF